MTESRKLDLNLLTVLHTILIERNITRTGERLGMTQPAVSGALARLRELYGDPLLEREGRGFTLTARARELQPAVAEAVIEAERTFNLMPAFDAATSTRTFLVAASDYVLSEITSPLLSVLEREAPRASIEFDSLPTNGQVTPVDLLRRDLTVSAAGRNVPGRQASLFSDRFVCIADSRNPALRGGGLSLSAISSLHHVLSVFGPSGTTMIDDMFAAASVVPRVAVTVQGFLPVPFAVVGTEWIGWVPERTARRFAGILGLTIADTPIRPRVLVEAAYWHPSKTNDPARRWLVQILRRASELVEFGTDPDGDDSPDPT